MPNKSRRSKAKQQARAAKAMQQGHPQQLRPIAVKPQSLDRIPPEVEDSTSRYQYVMPEVKHIAILAGSIILILIILSFVLG
ncbi:MAG: hypothetical protein JW732_00315 [Dehalococcoidia bacterium]|nr:hypothetical protein [Dehalococcoidia bacterium]